MLSKTSCHKISLSNSSTTFFRGLVTGWRGSNSEQQSKYFFKESSYVPIFCASLIISLLSQLINGHNKTSELAD